MKKIKKKMPDRELESQCSSEQSVYDLFKERHKKKLFAERIGNNIDEMEDDDLPTNKDDNDNTGEPGSLLQAQ